jgi:hypothetical protein
MFSRLGSGWGADSEDSVAGAIWNYFAGPSRGGTYFSFMDDESDNGESHVYKVVTTDPSNEGVSLPAHKSKNNKSRNFGYLRRGNQVNVFNPGGYDEAGNDCDDTTDLSAKLHVYTTVQTDGDNTYDMNFDGENSNCADEFGNQLQKCWEGLDAVPADGGFGFGQYVGQSLGTHSIRVSVFANINEGNLDSETGNLCNHRYHRVCGACNNSNPSLNQTTVNNNYKDDRVCGRESIRFEFRRIDKSNGDILDVGVIPEEFDPRGQAKHDGTQGGIRIKILKPGLITGGEEIEVEEDRAVWETEPKEDVGLDLYYEATHAIPQKLKEGNALAYAPLKSRVFIERTNPSTGGLILDNLDAGGIYDPVSVGGVEYLEDDVIIKVMHRNLPNTQTFGVDVFGIHDTDIGIGDTIVFEHKSGLQTKSVVEDYYVAPTGGANCTFVPQTSYTTTLTFDPTLDQSVSLSPTDNLEAGMSITGGNLPPGLFLDASLNVIGWPTSPSEHFNNTYSQVTGLTTKKPTGYYKIDKDVYKYQVKLGWHNCYSFGNGVESDRIRDDFNAPQIDNGVKVSTTINEYGKEDKSSSLIFSGLYNTTSGVNDLNEFNMGEKIIKDLNPEYGTVQALKTRDSDVVAFCEDRILKVQANKEAVFMADNDPNIVATDRVLGHVSTFKGDYGISRSPESLASDQYRLYFTDSQRGAVLRLSMDGLTPISNVGMTTWFRDNIIGATGYGIKLLGTFDKVNGEYNLSINNNKTISFNEGSKGWVSFKSFVPDQGVSVTGKYLTVKHGTIYEHYKDIIDLDTGEVNNRNLFYGAESLTPDAESTLTIAFNDVPSQVKSFKAMNYEGSQARIDQFVSETVNQSNYTDGEYYNLFGKQGWWVQDIRTDLQQGGISWFVDKENKWFNKISGQQTTLENLDTSEFTVQGIGSPLIVTLPEATTDADGNDTTTTTTTTTNDDGTTDTTTTVEENTYTFTIMNNTENDND